MGKLSKKRDDWRKQWREQWRRQLKRPTLTRIKYGFAYVYKPVLDDGPSRAFETMAEYRRWCRKNLPRYLGYWPAPAAHARKYEKRNTPPMESAAEKARRRIGSPKRTARK